MPPLPAPDYTPPTDPLDYLHVDEDLIAVVKPDGLLSVPGRGPHLADCLIARIADDYPDVLLVHRLDRDTSGVMIFARTAPAQRHLGLQFEKRQTRKVYEALVLGHVEGHEGRIDLPLCVDWENRPLQHVNHEKGRPAQTDWRVMEHLPGLTRMELTPLTGRSHQLRVHMLELGHPILGDTLYATTPDGKAERMMLHARALDLRHPTGGAWMEFRAPTPF
ncbi:RluA family pseudouridine synthase [Palleronia caenipelagi]|uniref:Dual-specificity RNA pseudouridine synthase RluA n=1 Tax=Palleronia caenipelagi TaxID=2489174 RepID=A0A547PNB6_9RHOB|nr:RluA family pseudouridine synthase [Palleronia caenipelagi]TRD15631.1 RluA family pseudouridine synthase [Palleronia caenipelagi]